MASSQGGVQEGDVRPANRGNIVRGQPNGPSSQKSKGNIKRYNLSLPDDLFNSIHELADKEHSTVLEILRKFIKLGLVAANISKDSNSKLIIREGDVEREILLL